jgi:hypothetical protein
MTVGSRKFLGLGINEILQRTVHSIGIYPLKVRMDLGSITLYLNKKHLSAVAIHAEINSVLGEGTVGYSTITCYLRKQSFANASHLAPEKPGLGAGDTTDNAILQALDESPLRHFARLPRGR